MRRPPAHPQRWCRQDAVAEKTTQETTVQREEHEVDTSQGSARQAQQEAARQAQQTAQQQAAQRQQETVREAAAQRQAAEAQS